MTKNIIENATVVKHNETVNDNDVTQKIKYTFWKGVCVGIAICVALAIFVELID